MDSVVEWKILTVTDVEGRLRAPYWIHNSIIRPRLTAEDDEVCNNEGDIIVPVVDAAQPTDEYSFVYEIRRYPDRRITPCRDFTEGWVIFRDQNIATIGDRLVFHWPQSSASLRLRLLKQSVPKPLLPAPVGGLLPHRQEGESSESSNRAGGLLDQSFHTIEVLLRILSAASAFDDLPIRHNEENHNARLAEKVPYKVDRNRLIGPHVKANLLFQAHFSRLEMPNNDYVTDLKSVLERSISVIEELITICARRKWLGSTINCMHLMQMVIQGLWFDNASALQMLPSLNNNKCRLLRRQNISHVRKLLDYSLEKLQNVLGDFPISRLFEDLKRLPWIHVNLRLEKRTRSASFCSLIVCLENNNRKRESLRAFAPRFPKARDEGWWIIVGNTETSELYALKKKSFSGRVITSFDLPSDQVSSKGMKLIVVSDSYLAYDLEYSLDKHHKDHPQ